MLESEHHKRHDLRIFSISHSLFLDTILILLSIALPSSPPPPPILLLLLLNILFLVSNLVSPSAGYILGGGDSQNCTLTPMHLRKAKLMFFWVRYPSSAIIKMYFPDIKFNKEQ